MFGTKPSYADCSTAGIGNKPTGYVFYNTDYQVLQICKEDGQWYALGNIHCPAGDGCGAGADNTPDAFSFTDQTGVATSTQFESDIIQITGMDDGTATSISGNSAEYRICTNGTSDANCDGSVIQNWTSGASTIDAGDYIQLRMDSSASDSTMVSTTMTIGTGSDQWDITTGSGGPTNCPSIGDTCDDGSIYAGLSPDGNVAMYTTPADAPSTYTWNDGTTNYTDMSMTNCTDTSPGTAATCQTGEANTTFLVGATGEPDHPFAAAEYCDGLTNVHGHSDWYLPAQDELNVLYTNKNTGDLNGTFNETGSFPAGYYWSSSEHSFNGARVQRFSDGLQGFNGKTSGLAVRCVRR